MVVLEYYVFRLSWISCFSTLHGVVDYCITMELWGECRDSFLYTKNIYKVGCG